MATYVTYMVLNIFFLMVALIVLAWRKLLSFSHAVWLTLVVLLVMTIMFDSLIIHFEVVAYDLNKILGVRVELAPIEDLLYSLLAGLAGRQIGRASCRERV